MVEFYTFLHIASAILLTAFTFAACAAPKPETRKRTMIVTGVLSLLMLTGGFGLLARVYPGEFPVWVMLKVACWLGLSALAGFAYRKPESAGTIAWIAGTLAVVAVAAVEFLRPALS